jgi:hypothetical protein
MRVTLFEAIKIDVFLKSNLLGAKLEERTLTVVCVSKMGREASWGHGM